MGLFEVLHMIYIVSGFFWTDTWAQLVENVITSKMCIESRLDMYQISAGRARS